MKPIDSTDAELEAFEAVCRRLAGFNPRVSAEWADGWLTAVAASPLARSIDQWLPLLAGDDFGRAFADPEDVAQARTALAGRLQVLMTQLDPEALLDHPDELRLSPLVLVWDDEARRQLVEEQGIDDAEARLIHTGAVWAEGFFDALEDFADLWQAPKDLEADEREWFDDSLRHVSVLLMQDDDVPFQAHVEQFWKDRLVTREDLLDEACFAVQDLRVWWVDHAPKPPTRRVEAVPGRNDPCFCGSGQKYKKCHGRAA